MESIVFILLQRLSAFQHQHLRIFALLALIKSECAGTCWHDTIIYNIYQWWIASTEPLGRLVKSSLRYRIDRYDYRHRYDSFKDMTSTGFVEISATLQFCGLPLRNTSSVWRSNQVYSVVCYFFHLQVSVVECTSSYGPFSIWQAILQQASVCSLNAAVEKYFRAP